MGFHRSAPCFVKRGGITPTHVVGTPFSTNVRPIDAGIQAVLRDPHLVRHHKHGRRARLDVGVDDAAAELRRHA